MFDQKQHTNRDVWRDVCWNSISHGELFVGRHIYGADIVKCAKPHDCVIPNTDCWGVLE